MTQHEHYMKGMKEAMFVLLPSSNDVETVGNMVHPSELLDFFTNKPAKLTEILKKDVNKAMAILKTSNTHLALQLLQKLTEKEGKEHHGGISSMMDQAARKKKEADALLQRCLEWQQQKKKNTQQKKKNSNIVSSVVMQKIQETMSILLSSSEDVETVRNMIHPSELMNFFIANKRKLEEVLAKDINQATAILEFSRKHSQIFTNHSPTPEFPGGPADIEELHKVPIEETVFLIQALSERYSSQTKNEKTNTNSGHKNQSKNANKVKMKHCGNCGSVSPPNGKFKICTKCRVVRYCNIACQRTHWVKGEHHKHCC